MESESHPVQRWKQHIHARLLESPATQFVIEAMFEKMVFSYKHVDDLTQDAFGEGTLAFSRPASSSPPPCSLA